MIWCAISGYSKTRPILISGNSNASRYITEVLQAEVLPFLQQNSDVRMYQLDNASAHRSAQVTSTNLLAFPWPTMSPDLNPIEHVWNALKRHIGSENPENLVSSARSVISAWESLPDTLIRNVVESMPRRVQQCIRKRCGHTGY